MLRKAAFNENKELDKQILKLSLTITTKLPPPDVIQPEPEAAVTEPVSYYESYSLCTTSVLDSLTSLYGFVYSCVTTIINEKQIRGGITIIKLYG